ncbi:hypothetical protein C3L33_20490, partial [Rhododendron williamsianum]
MCRLNGIRLEEKEKREKELSREIIEQAEKYKTEFYRRRKLACENNKVANREKEKKQGPQTNPLRYHCYTGGKVKRDLVLLENQIPFFVLEKLFPLTVGRIPDRPDKDWSLTDYVWWCYAINMMPEQNSSNSGSAKSSWCSPSDCVLRVFQSGKNIDHHRSPKYSHILHYLHDSYLPPLDKVKKINSLQEICLRHRNLSMQESSLHPTQETICSSSNSVSLKAYFGGVIGLISKSHH